MLAKYLSVIVVFFALLAISPAQADYDFGMAAMGAKDYYNAIKEFKSSADDGDANSQHALSRMYIYAIALPQNNDKAAFWAGKAAEQGHAGAQSVFGSYYSEGTKHTPKDMIKAYMWSTLAAKQGYKVAISNCKFWIEKKLISPQEVEKAEKLAAEWKPKNK